MQSHGSNRLFLWLFSLELFHLPTLIIKQRRITMNNKDILSNKDFIISVLENSYDGIYVTDTEGLTLYVNKAYEKLAERDRSEYIGKYMSSLMDSGQMTTYITKDVVATGKTITVSETLVSGKQVIITGNPIFDDTGNIIAVVTNVRDISEIFALKRKESVSNGLLSFYKNLYFNPQELDDIVCESPQTIAVFNIAKKAASTDSTVLLTGETGTGKDVVAKYIHYNSACKNENYIKINCGAIPANLIESELLGYVNGAFTGADPNGRPGIFEMAHNGTLFLDEIGELPLDMQSAFLRVIQDGEVTRMGDTVTRKVNVRIIAATNRDLHQMIKEGTFREDLYYRLNVVSIHIPPLRDRLDDIPALAELFIRQLNEKYHEQKRASNTFLMELMSMSWPGNVRELFNFVEQQFVMSESVIIELSAYTNDPSSYGSDPAALLSEDVNSFSLNSVLSSVEASIIKYALKKCRTANDAASLLGISQPTFSRRYNKYKDMGLL